jgi:translation initiation factor 5A
LNIQEDGFMSLMAESGDLREDLKLPEGELGQKIKEEYDSGKELLVRL